MKQDIEAKKQIKKEIASGTLGLNAAFRLANDEHFELVPITNLEKSWVCCPFPLPTCLTIS